MKKILVVFGTRPEAIKLCPLVLELKKEPRFRTLVCVTGQHRQMLDQMLHVFGVTPDYDLAVMKNKQTLFDMTTDVLCGMKEILQQEMPDVVLVHGDTTTSFAAALAAFYLNIPVGHVEAGLRTYDLRSPFPEEFNRQCVDLLSEYDFAPTQTAKDNLLRAGKPENRIFVTGNTVIDALKITTEMPCTNNPVLDLAENDRLVLLTAHRRENLGQPLYNIFRGIRRVLAEHPEVKLVYPVHLNPQVRTAAAELLGDCSQIQLLEPMGVVDFHHLMNRSWLILTDSGGIQEEASALGKPVLVLRNTTERPEGISSGHLKLIGTSEDAVYREFSELLTNEERYLSMCQVKNPYGDGNACHQIIQVLKDRL